MSPGDFVKFKIWNGKVEDVFESPVTGQKVVRVLFAKNLLKDQPAELLPLDDDAFEPSNLEAFEAEFAAGRERQERRATLIQQTQPA